MHPHSFRFAICILTRTYRSKYPSAPRSGPKDNPVALAGGRDDVRSATRPRSPPANRRWDDWMNASPFFSSTAVRTALVR